MCVRVCTCAGNVHVLWVSGMLYQRFLEQINVLGVENETVSQAGLRVKGIFKCPGFTSRESGE